VSPTVRFAVGIDAGEYKIGDRVEVEGQLVARYFPPRVMDGQKSAAVQSVEIRGARLVSRP
jgi:hypothetical protein